MINETAGYNIGEEILRAALESARHYSSSQVRARVVTTRVVASTVRGLIEDAGLRTADGRLMRPGVAELLDIADFEAGPWRVEVRVVAESVSAVHVGKEKEALKVGLLVPTVPLMVGAFADFYLAVTVDRQLSRLATLGFVGLSDLGRARLNSDGLFLEMEREELTPFSLLPAFLRLPRSLNEDHLELMESWQLRAAALVDKLTKMTDRETGLPLGPDAVQQVVEVVRDEFWQIHRARMMKEGLQPIFEHLEGHFKLRRPQPQLHDDPIAFRNSVADQEMIDSRGVGPLIEALLKDQLTVAKRVALYRHLLTDEAALRELQAARRILDLVTDGRHQSTRRQVEYAQRRRRRSELLLDVDSSRSDQKVVLPSKTAQDEWPNTISLASLNVTDFDFNSSEIGELMSMPRPELDGGAFSSPPPIFSQSVRSEGDGPSRPSSILFQRELIPSRQGTMNIFEFRDHLIGDYQQYIRSFMRMRDQRISTYVEGQLGEGVFYPDPLIQLNPAFARGESITQLIEEGALHPECERIFRRDKEGTVTSGSLLNLHRHQAEAIREAGAGRNYVVTTGTGSGKSLSYIIPIVNQILREGSGRGIRAIIVYPMNALANSQEGELDKYLAEGYAPGQPPVTYARYTGQEDHQKREEIMRRPPDILLTNYVMLELLLTRPYEQKIVDAARGLRFLVLDELHTYRGRQGADVALLVRRLRDRLEADRMICVGTSATIAGGDNFESQRGQVARVATTLFGAKVNPESVIFETLERKTSQVSESVDLLRRRVVTASMAGTFPTDYEKFIADPLVAWIEGNLGLEEREGRLVRRQPTRITGVDGAAEKLASLLAIPATTCRVALQNALLAGTECERHPVTGAAPLTFRLHQFISRGDTVYATLEDEASRYLTLFGQHYRPGSREHVLLPLVFCRECGQEYYSVSRIIGKKGAPDSFVARQDYEPTATEGVDEAGFLYLSTSSPFPIDPAEMIERERLPLEWIVDKAGLRQVDQSKRALLPQPVRVGTNGQVGGEGVEASYVKAPFQFCLTCGVSWNRRQRNDFSKLATLGSEGRSTVTTITNLTAIRRLREERLPASARKLLSFTDNRQDASLQAGHFNDFIETTLIRTALWQALDAAGDEGIGHDELTGLVFEALRLDPQLYARNPDERFQNRKDTELALRNILGYRLYRDLERGWRITLPNLEQCGLLRIEYQSLEEVCAADEEWADQCEPLRLASPATRRQIGEVLLDHLRRELAISVRYLDSGEQDRIRSQSYQRLVAPWAIDEVERMTHASILFPGSRQPGDTKDNIFLSSRSGFGQYLRRPQTFGATGPHGAGSGVLTTDQTQEVIDGLLKVFTGAGLLHQVVEERGDQPPGYQLNAGVMRWRQGDGREPFHDPIRMPSPPSRAGVTATEDGQEAHQLGRTNSYFVDFYTSDPTDLKQLEAREHTAQVPGELREEREDRFREGELPILYCSPTMELGVDIADLNVVNLRNVPPTPANYAQRSGRAGRSGQPALVFTYCAIGSPHDQYFFKRPELMVAGQVTPPRLDLANEDLVRSHIHSIWLAETGQSLHKSLVQLLQVEGENPSLTLMEGLRERIDSEAARRRAAHRACQMLDTIKPDLESAGWFTPNWLDGVLSHCPEQFDRTADRWRDLYRAALNEQETQSRIIRDASRSAEDKRKARQTRALAEAQLRLLTEVENTSQSDFYSYRYFASEGFLPGYSFPRLPISAYIPARHGSSDRNEFVSRPRFLAISEFGPRSVIYHEGSKYVINKVILPVGEEEAGNVRIKLCEACGYLHEIREAGGEDICQRCSAPLGMALSSLFRMQNVSTQRRERITADEEERLRYGYEIITGVQFQERPDRVPTATVVGAGEPLATLTYGQAATLWRINKGWNRRKQREKPGFLLDLERGYWKREADDPDESGTDFFDEPTSARVRRVIPYVDDRRNCLTLEPVEPLSLAAMASLQAALKAAIQICYQLEDNEIAVEPLPTFDDRRQLLFYESAEGGAGILHQLVREPQAFAKVAAAALEICHFDPTGADLRHAPRAKEDCEAACYDCLLSYHNQREHEMVDRHSIRQTLLQLAAAKVQVSPVALPRAAHLQQLHDRAESSLEHKWLDFVAAAGYRLPSLAQPLLAEAGTRPDFLYEEESTAVYIDGPDHLTPEARARDRRQDQALDDLGYSVIRFPLGEDWEAIIRSYPHVFGPPLSAEVVGQSSSDPIDKADPELSPGQSDQPEQLGLTDRQDLFDSRYHELLGQLISRFPGLRVDSGADIESGGQVVGSYFAEILLAGRRLRLLEAGQLREDLLSDVVSREGDLLVINPHKIAEAIELIGVAFNREV